MKKQTRLLTVFLFGMFAASGWAQKPEKEDFLGKWVFQKLYSDTTCVMDANDSTVLIRSSMEQAKKMNPDFSAQDSIRILEHCRKRSKGLNTVFMEFLEDGTYRTLAIKGNRGVDTKVDTGKYTFNRKKGIIEFETNHPSISTTARLEKNKLLVDVTTNGKSVTIAYIHE